MIRILVLIACHGRPRITELCFEGLERLRAHVEPWAELVPWVVTDDSDILRLAERYRYDVCVVPNRPLGQKFNLGLEKALGVPWDYLMQLGSDDLVGNQVMDVYRPLFESGRDFWGQTDLYFLDSQTGSVKFLTSDTVYGAARCVRRDLVELVGFDREQRIRTNAGPGFVLWAPLIARGLDKSSAFHFSCYGLHPSRVECGARVLDVKGEENIWSFTQFPGKRTSSSNIDFLSPKEWELLDGLRLRGQELFLFLLRRRAARLLSLSKGLAKRLWLEVRTRLRQGSSS